MQIKDLKGKTIAFASSGGLDSCTVTKWLTENGVKVVSITADLGQPDEVNMDEIKDRMLKSGAIDAILVDLKKEIAEAGLTLIQTQAHYEGGYWNTTGIARHVTVKGLLKAMKKKNIKILAHGATGRGNDQVRFSLASYMIDSKVEVYAPWRDPAFISAFGGRKEMIDYCLSHKLPIKVSYDKPYSTDANLLGLTHEAGKLEFLDTPATFVSPIMGVFPKNAPDKSEKFSVRFEKGIPVKINGKKTNLLDAFYTSNTIAGKHAVGIGIHAVENRFVGIKSRGVYESPGLVLLARCYDFLLQQIIDRRARNFYEYTSARIAEQIYQGYFFDLATNMMLSSLKPVNALVTGTIEVELYKGNIIFLSSKDAPASLYDPELSSMESVGSFNHMDSEGFIRVLGVSAKALKVKGQLD
ncbi:MAG: hypothetical protein ACD_79C00063G0006 [uncultured bacterium]|nr:MAG: hypothetical protein ACD_79C00063G0006 [uncultured bacterium]